MKHCLGQHCPACLLLMEPSGVSWPWEQQSAKSSEIPRTLKCTRKTFNYSGVWPKLSVRIKPMRHQLDSPSLEKNSLSLLFYRHLTANCNFISLLFTPRLNCGCKYTTGSFPKGAVTLASGSKSQAQFSLCPVHTQSKKDSL